MQIAIEGEIGWEVTSKNIREQLDNATGDVELLVNSPGGVVTEGIAIYNAIRDYKRKKNGRVVARVVGMAASMATYIPMAADEIQIEDNAIWMIHNPWGLAMGDYNDMRKTMDILDGLAKILARGYAKKTGKTEEEIRSLMDEETYLYGSDIMAFGFADSMVPAGDGAEDQSEAMALAQSRLEDLKKKLKELDEKPEDRAQLVALLKTAGVAREIQTETRPNAGEKREALMNKEQLVKEYPDLYAEIKAEGRDEERARVQELRAYTEADQGNAKVEEIVGDAIASGKKVSDIFAKLQVAIRDGKKEDGENPAIVATAKDPMNGIDDIDRQAMKAFGLSVDDVKRAKGGLE